MEHTNFWLEFAGKVGGPTFSATLVACLLSGDLYFLHGILMMAGLGMMWGRERAVEMLNEAGFNTVEMKLIPEDTFNLHFLCRK